MFSMTIQGASLDELKANIAMAVESLGGEAASTVSAVKRAIGSTANVVAPKKASKTPAKAAEVEEDNEEEEADDDLGEGDDSGNEEITRDDVKTLLLEVKSKFPNDASAVGKLVGKFNAKLLKEVDEDDLPELAKAARAKLASAKKK